MNNHMKDMNVFQFEGLYNEMACLLFSEEFDSSNRKKSWSSDCEK